MIIFFKKRKQGLRDVQFMEWLEYIYGCNFVTAIETSYFESEIKGAHSYRITTQKEIFPILDKCHCIPQEGDVAAVTTELDNYNWFYYFAPFEKEIFEKTINNIGASLKRKPRKIHIININPKFYDVILNSGCFELTNQFCIATRQKVVDVFVSKKEYEK